MGTPESKVHSFIVKLWMEEANEAGQAAWHGFITHVPDGGRHYLQNLDEIVSFIKPYVAEMSADTRSSPGYNWLKPWARRKR
jgi:hypothetical protein